MSWQVFSPEVGIRPGDYDSDQQTLLAEMPIPPGDFDPRRIAVFARMSFALMGCALELRDSDEQTAAIQLQAQGQLANVLLQDIADSKLKTVDGLVSVDGKHVLEFGQHADLSKLRPISQEEIEFAEAHRDIIIGAEHVPYDGGVRVRLGEALTIMRETRLANSKAEQERRAMYIHGRAGVQHFTRLRIFDPDIDVLGSTVRGKVNLSLGPYTGIIQPQTYFRDPSGNFQQLPWQNIKGSGLIHSFALGLLDRYDKNVVLHTDAPDSSVTSPSDVWVDLELYRTQEKQNARTSIYTNWYTLSDRKKERLHLRGADLVEVLDLKDVTQQEKFFDFSRLNNSREYRAMVISPHGVTPVGVPAEEREFFEEQLIESVRLEDRYRGIPSEYEEDFTEIVDEVRRVTPEGARILVLDILPAPELLTTLYQEGVRAVIFKNMSNQHGDMASAAVNHTMQNLTRNGMQFIQLDEAGDMWVYHAEQMVRHELLENYEDATIRITNYGTANENRMSHKEDMQDFLANIVDFFGDDARSSIVFEDGGGPGNMRSTSLMAKKLDVLNSGVAIWAEVVDGQTSRKSEYGAYWMYPVSDISTRQRSMDMGRSIAIIHPGGFGTFFEAITSGLSTQLLEKIPIPVFVIDEQKKLDGLKDLLKDMCRPNENGHCLAAPWTEKIFVFCESYAEAKDKFIEIMPNLKTLWHEILDAGMSIEQFKHAAEREVANLKDRGLDGPNEFFAAQVRDFIYEVEDNLATA